MPIEIVFETHCLSEDNEQGIATGWLPGRPPSQCARAGSHPGSQHVELTAGQGRVEAVLDQPAGRHQASP